MNTLKIKNIDTFKINAFLTSIDKMPAKQSRARTKLSNELTKISDEYVASQKQLVEEMGGAIDENLKISFSADNLEAKKIVDKNLFELAFEETIVQEKFVGQYETLKLFFDEYDEEITASHAYAYDKLLDLLEEGE